MSVEKVKVNVISSSTNPLPEYKHSYDAGCDVMANLPIDDEVIIAPGECVKVPVGISTAIPIGYFVMLVPRSGLAAKYSISICNAPGTIDSGYINEYAALVINHGNKAFVIKNGDRIAQLILLKYAQIEWNEVDKLEQVDDRGLGGFGSSGI